MNLALKLPLLLFSRILRRFSGPVRCSAPGTPHMITALAFGHSCIQPDTRVSSVDSCMHVRLDPVPSRDMCDLAYPSHPAHILRPAWRARAEAAEREAMQCQAALIRLQENDWGGTRAAQALRDRTDTPRPLPVASSVGDPKAVREGACLGKPDSGENDKGAV